MKRLFITLIATLLLAGAASAQNFFESRERSRQFQRNMRDSSYPVIGERQWTEDYDNIERARELDRMRNSRRQDRGWQGTGGGIRSDSYDGGW